MTYPQYPQQGHGHGYQDQPQARWDQGGYPPQDQGWHDQNPYVSPPPPKKKWPWVVGGIIVLIVLGSALGGGRGKPTTSVASTGQGVANAEPVAAAPAAPVQTGPLTQFSDGMYEVGVDIEPGQYTTPGSGGEGILESCYVARTKDDSGQLKSIIMNDNFNGRKSVTVKAGEFLEVNRGCVWSKK